MGDERGQLILGMPRDSLVEGFRLGRDPGPDLGGHTRHLAASIVGAAPGSRSGTARPLRAPPRAHTYFTRASDRRAVDAQATHAAGREIRRPTEGRWERQLPRLLGAVSFLLRPRVTALGTNELRRRARRGLHGNALRRRPPPSPVLWPGARKTPVLCKGTTHLALSDSQRVAGEGPHGRKSWKGRQNPRPAQLKASPSFPGFCTSSAQRCPTLREVS